jgi:hypothetical protein
MSIRRSAGGVFGAGTEECGINIGRDPVVDVAADMPDNLPCLLI